MPTCAAGKLLLIGVFIDTDANITGDWTGWTQLANATNYSGTTAQVEHRYKTSTGSDTLTLETDASVRISYIVRCISGQHATAAPEASVAVAATSTSQDPGSLTPSWGAANTLWIAYVGYDAAGSTASVSAYPTNYDNNQVDAGDNATVGYAQATRNLNATSDDPAAFTLDASDAGLAGVIAIRPAATGCKGGMLFGGVGC
jgi:hypothetical protein